jgi:hypothetical protein
MMTETYEEQHKTNNRLVCSHCGEFFKTRMGNNPEDPDDQYGDTHLVDDFLHIGNVEKCDHSFAIFYPELNNTCWHLRHFKQKYRQHFKSFQ